MFCKYTIKIAPLLTKKNKNAPLIRVYKIEFMTRSTSKLKSKQNVKFVIQKYFLDRFNQFLNSVNFLLELFSSVENV